MHASQLWRMIVRLQEKCRFPASQIGDCVGVGKPVEISRSLSKLTRKYFERLLYPVCETLIVLYINSVAMSSDIQDDQKGEGSVSSRASQKFDENARNIVVVRIYCGAVTTMHPKLLSKRREFVFIVAWTAWKVLFMRYRSHLGKYRLGLETSIRCKRHAQNSPRPIWRR